jgi:hypothetical protein
MRHVPAWHAAVWLGSAGFGEGTNGAFNEQTDRLASSGSASPGSAGRGAAWLASARRGQVRQGFARSGRFWLGLVRHGAQWANLNKDEAMKERIDEVTAAVEELATLTNRYERGQIVPWSEIEAVSGSRNENRGKYIIGKWRKRLEREREIVTLCAETVGVRLLTHKETATEIPRIRQRRAYRQIRRAIKQTSLVDTGRLTTHERRLLAAQRDNMAQQRRELHRSQRQLANGIVPTEVNPRRLATA